jgi:hypothetical protein
MSVTQSSQNNRRISPRRKPRSVVKVECRKGALGLGKNICTRLLDISESGMRLIVKYELKPKDEVEILVSGAGMAGTVKRLADVCWVVPTDGAGFCIGVRFQKLLPYRDIQAIALP